MAFLAYSPLFEVSTLENVLMFLCRIHSVMNARLSTRLTGRIIENARLANNIIVYSNRILSDDKPGRNENKKKKKNKESRRIFSRPLRFSFAQLYHGYQKTTLFRPPSRPTVTYKT